MNSKNIINNIFSISIRIAKPSGLRSINGVTPSERNEVRNRFYSDGTKETPITITFVLPTNIKTVDETERSSTIIDSSRHAFNDSRMSLAETGKDHSSNQQNSSTHPYDVASTAQMPTPNQNHVPEPFNANDSGSNLKEGMSGGIDGQQRWSMGDRMDHDRKHK